MPKPRGMLHALVLWGKTAEDKKIRDAPRLCDVIELSSVPRKFRREGATPMLKWMDKRTGKASIKKATIIKISDSIEHLQDMSISITGNATDSSDKEFGSHVRRKRKELQPTTTRKQDNSAENEDDYASPTNSPLRSEDEDNDEPAEDTDTKTERFVNAMKGLASQVTNDNIRFLESILEAMKASNLAQERSEPKDVPTDFKIPAYFTTPGKGKVPLWEGMDFYFCEGVKASIESKSHVLDKTSGSQIRHWPLLVRLALVEIYGKKLADHSAKGSKFGSRPAIDPRLFRAIHYWASDWVGNEIDVDAYVDHINKTCYNKRKYKTKVPGTETPKSAKKVTATSSSASIEFVDVGQPATVSGHPPASDSKSALLFQLSNPNPLCDPNDCNFSTLVEGREKVRVAFLGPTPSPATPGVLLLEPLLPISGHLIDGMSASPAELLTTHTEHTSPAYHAQISTDSGWDNPFRPDGDLSREADEIVELIKGGKPITPTPGQNAPALPGCEAGTGKTIEGDLPDSSTSPLLNASCPANSTGRSFNQGNGNAHGTPGKAGNANSATKQQPVNEKVGQATTATVEVGRVTAQGPGDASQVEHVTLKKKPKCKCCVLQ